MMYLETKVEMDGGEGEIDAPRYRDARIRRATARPSSYWMVCMLYRASRSWTARSSRRSHFRATGSRYFCVLDVLV